MTFSVFLSGLQVMADCFISCDFKCFFCSFYVSSDVIFSINVIGSIHKFKGIFRL